MASTEPKQPQAQQAQGAQGETCAGCGKPLAADQRYCLNCGTRRADSRVDFEKYLFGAEASSPNGLARAPASSRGWNPLAAAALLGLLGIMLLVGILIGKDENDDSQPSATTPPAQTAPATTAPSATPAPTTPVTPATPPPSGSSTTPTPVAPGAAESEAGVAPKTKAPTP